MTAPGACTFRLTAPATVLTAGDGWSLEIRSTRRGGDVTASRMYGPADHLPTLCRLLLPRSDVVTEVTAAVTAAGSSLTVGDALDPALADCAAPLQPPLPPVVASQPDEPVPADLPAGVPAAARRPAPLLPSPAGWPFGEGFPATAGTGRLDQGADLFTSFLLDDHGARGTSTGPQDSTLAPTRGTFRYAAPAARGNGADVFRSAVGLDTDASYWRVDWRTLVDSQVPLAVWGLDTDADPTTGTATWPAGAGVMSPGLERALVVSSRGAHLLDLVAGTSTRLPVDVTLAGSFPGSFVVRVPRPVLPVAGTWRVRLVAGLATAGGTALAPVAAAQGASSGQPPVYDVGYRTREQEPPSLEVAGLATANNWNEVAQAQALKDGTVATFSRLVGWDRLAARESTPEPRPTGVSVRWYASPLETGAGVTPTQLNKDPGRALTYRGRVQPYAYYRPLGAGPHRFVLLNHSLGDAHTQYSTQDPRLLAQLCGDRDAVCAMPLGHGQDGKGIDAAEVDAWRVVRSAADADRLDPDRFVVAGYSMGGHASLRLGLLYPDVWAGALVLSGPPSCGVGVAAGLSYDGNGRCRTEADTGVLAGNARWLPLVMADGGASQIVPLPAQREQVQRWDDAGFRYAWFVYPAEDHVVWPTKDRFDDVVAALGDPVRERRPPRVDLTWYPDLVDPLAGIGTSGAWWVRDLVGDHTVPGSLASVHASSRALVDPEVLPVRSTTPVASAAPSPYVLRQLDWSFGQALPLADEVLVAFANVRSARLALDEAGLAGGGSVRVSTDRSLRLTLSGLDGQVQVRLGPGRPLRPGPDRRVVLELPAGSSVLVVHEP